MTVALDEAMDEYLALVRAFPLISIRDDAHLAQALEIIDRLTGQSVLSDAEDAYLGALTDLVETYEDAHVAIPPTTGLDALQYLIAENGLMVDEVAAIIGDTTRAAALLSGANQLSLDDVRKLAGYFGVPPGVFIE